MRAWYPLQTLLLGAAAIGLSACNSTRQSNTARTATEQLLIANSIDQSLDKVDFGPLAESQVFVEEKYLDCVDKGYLIASIRHRLLRHGAGIATKPEEADVILEVRAGAIGTDLSSSFLGVPEITLPGMLTLPEVKVVSKDAQKAAAKVGLVAYDAKTKRLLGEGGVSNSFADETNTFVFGMGPWQDGTLRQELDHSATYGAQRPIDHVPPLVTFARPTPPTRSARRPTLGWRGRNAQGPARRHQEVTSLGPSDTSPGPPGERLVSHQSTDPPGTPVGSVCAFVAGEDRVARTTATVALVQLEEVRPRHASRRAPHAAA